jgi:hypothetical protein
MLGQARAKNAAGFEGGVPVDTLRWLSRSALPVSMLVAWMVSCSCERAESPASKLRCVR